MLGALPTGAVATRLVAALERPSPGVTVLSPSLLAPPAAAAGRWVVAATFTADPLLPALELWRRELELPAPLEIAPSGRMHELLLDPAGPLAGAAFVALLVRPADWGRDAGPAERLQVIERAAVLMLVCPSGEDLVADRLLAAAAELPGVTAARAADRHADYAVGVIEDPVRDRIARIPHAPSYGHVLGSDHDHVPDECLIAGQKAAIVERFLRLLPARVTPVPHVRFYGGATRRPYRVRDVGAVAGTIAAMVTRTADWPALAERAYQDGVRVFVEAGPRGLLTSALGGILGARPHLAVALDAASGGLHALVDGTLALWCAGVRVDLDAARAMWGKIVEEPLAPALDRSTG